MLFWLVILFLLFSWALDWVSDYLNVKHFQPKLPDEFKGYYDNEKYEKSQRYLKETTRFGIIQGVFSSLLFLIFIFMNGFQWLDLMIRGWGYSELITGLFYLGILSVSSQVFRQNQTEKQRGSSSPMRLSLEPSRTHSSRIAQ